MPDNTNTHSEVDAAAKLAVAASNVKTHPGFRPLILVPPNFKVEKLEPDWLEALPDHIRQTVNIAELESFIRYVKQFKTFSAQVFAVQNELGARFLAVLDYHESGNEAKARRAKHMAVYAPAYSDDFNAWCKVNGKPMTQADFLDHLRKWGDTITSHTDADMIELASSLDFKVDAQFSSHVERTTGGRKLLYDERVEGSGQMKKSEVKVPDSMTLKLPIFVGGKEYQIGVELLYRPQNGHLHIIVELKRPHLIVRQAIKDIIEDVKAGTDLDPFFGSLA